MGIGCRNPLDASAGATERRMTMACVKRADMHCVDCGVLMVNVPVIKKRCSECKKTSPNYGFYGGCGGNCAGCSGCKLAEKGKASDDENTKTDGAGV